MFVRDHGWAHWIYRHSKSSCRIRPTCPPHRRATPRVIPITAGPTWAWNAGVDGRMVLDPLCGSASSLLAAGGSMLLVQSALSGVEKSMNTLRSTGLDAEVIASQWVPFGPVLSARAGWLEVTGRIRKGLPDRGAGGDPGGQAMTDRTRVQVIPNGPVLVSGPVRIETPDGDVVESDRFMVAICTCRAQQELSVVRHQPSALSACAGAVSPAVVVTTFPRPSTTP